MSVCRERCGGQGYLSCNRFGTFIGLAHAAMTAEGDNSVLMQKVGGQGVEVKFEICAYNYTSCLLFLQLFRIEVFIICVGLMWYNILVDY